VLKLRVCGPHKCGLSKRERRNEISAMNLKLRNNAPDTSRDRKPILLALTMGFVSVSVLLGATASISIDKMKYSVGDR